MFAFSFGADDRRPSRTQVRGRWVPAPSVPLHPPCDPLRRNFGSPDQQWLASAQTNGGTPDSSTQHPVAQSLPPPQIEWHRWSEAQTAPWDAPTPGPDWQQSVLDPHADPGAAQAHWLGAEHAPYDSPRSGAQQPLWQLLLLVQRAWHCWSSPTHTRPSQQAEVDVQVSPEGTQPPALLLPMAPNPLAAVLPALAPVDCVVQAKAPLDMWIVTVVLLCDDHIAVVVCPLVSVRVTVSSHVRTIDPTLLLKTQPPFLPAAAVPSMAIPLRSQLTFPEHAIPQVLV